MRITSVFDIIYLLGAAQGLFVFLLLWNQKKNTKANRFLAFAILAIAASAAYMSYIRLGLYLSDPRWLRLIDTLPLLYGPLFYFYTYFMITREEREPSQKRRIWVHFAPFASFTLLNLPRFFMNGAEKLSRLQTEAQVGLTWDLIVLEWFANAQGVLYFCASLLLLRRYRSAIQESHSNTDRINLVWLTVLMSTLLALWIGSICGYVISSKIYPYVHSALVIIIYVIGYLSMRQPQVTPPATEARPVKYQKTRLEERRAQEIEKRLVAFMQTEKPYLAPELGLNELAKRLELAPHQLSQVLNERIGKNFYDFVNAYRVEELKRKLSDPKCANEKILSLALDCGFNSKSTFNSIFKKHTGVAPSQFRANANATATQARQHSPS